MDEVLAAYYYNPKRGFQSSEKLYKRLKDDTNKYSLSAIKDWINKQSVQQQFKHTKIIKKYFPIVSPNEIGRAHV